jgi:cell division protein FtsB
MSRFITDLKKKPPKVLLQNCLIGILSILCAYYILNILFLDNYSLRVYLSSKNDLRQLAVLHDGIVETNIKLETEIQKLRTDAFHIESIARRDYRMVKKGETVFVFSRN